MSGFSPDPSEVDPLEKQLQTLIPSSCGLDRDRLMFVAGQQAVASADKVVIAQQLKFWRYSTICSMTTSLCLGVALIGNTFRPPSGEVREMASGSETESPPSPASVRSLDSPNPEQPQAERTQPELTLPVPATQESFAADGSYFQLRREWLTDPESLNEGFPPSREIASARAKGVDDSPISLQSFRRGATSDRDDPSRPVRTNSLIDSIFGDTL